MSSDPPRNPIVSCARSHTLSSVALFGRRATASAVGWRLERSATLQAVTRQWTSCILVPLLIRQQSIKMEGAGRHLGKWPDAPQEGVPDEPFIHRPVGLLSWLAGSLRHVWSRSAFVIGFFVVFWGVDGCVARVGCPADRWDSSESTLPEIDCPGIRSSTSVASVISKATSTTCRTIQHQVRTAACRGLVRLRLPLAPPTLWQASLERRGSRRCLVSAAIRVARPGCCCS